MHKIKQRIQGYLFVTCRELHSNFDGVSVRASERVSQSVCTLILCLKV